MHVLIFDHCDSPAKCKTQTVSLINACVSRHHPPLYSSYVSEKLMDCLQVGSIPVYWGAPSLDRFWPQWNSSVLMASQFATMELLAARMREIASNKTLFDSYLSWKREPVLPAVMDQMFHGFGNIMCRACAQHHAWLNEKGLG